MEQEHSAEVAPSRTGMSRRVVVKSAAWSVPVFATVGVTPAFAVTPGEIESASMTAARITTGNGKTVNFTVTINWSGSRPAGTISVGYMNGTSFTVSGGPSTLPANDQLSFQGSNGPASETTVPSFTFSLTSSGLTVVFTVPDFVAPANGDTVARSLDWAAV